VTHTNYAHYCGYFFLIFTHPSDIAIAPKLQVGTYLVEWLEIYSLHRNTPSSNPKTYEDLQFTSTYNGSPTKYRKIFAPSLIWDYIPNYTIHSKGIVMIKMKSTMIKVKSTLVAPALVLSSTFFAPQQALACGGFFCSLVPINQAGEQIIFRQDGDNITAMVQIQYVGEAEDFAWVVPVPGIPDFHIGSDLIFNGLEAATRPQFQLLQTGDVCQSDIDNLPPIPESEPTADFSSASGDNGVSILSQQSVGPFDIQVVESEDPSAMAAWLVENNYDLSDRGIELLQPYIEEGMNFVALKLQQGKDAGDIEPLVMNYQSAKPMVPIKLTAVAAQEDMGILVWLLGDGRAVPLNYPHVTPNYTKIDWFNSFRAYQGYQDLITEAMNEVGGHGFATDYAGRDIDVLSQLQTGAFYQEVVDSLQASDGGVFVVNTFFSPFANDQITAILQRHLPLPADSSTFDYGNLDIVNTIFTAEAIAAAKPLILEEIQLSIVDTYVEGLEIFEGDKYLTRVYTTLSADEMTLDPVFGFNPDMADQPRTREATLHSECIEDSTQWSLTLGSGTQRDGEVVMTGDGLPPNYFGFGPVPIEQTSSFVTETTSESNAPVVVAKKGYTATHVTLDSDGTFKTSGGEEIDSTTNPTTGPQTGTTNPEPAAESSSGGGGAMYYLLLALAGLTFNRRR
tara:strand:- start:1149 stop:3182 length:2034 start_codon:yes stop_codon:yes gene_type:complete